MTFLKTTIGLSAALAALGLLSACDQAKPRPGEAPQAAAPGAPAGPAAVAELPAVPTWAQAVVGQTLKTAFPGEGACDGNTDMVELRGQGGATGATVLGWAWDPAAKAPVERIILVDKDQKIVGGGESGLPRSDVRTARPDITSDAVGWRGVSTVSTGGLDAYGLVGDGKSTCKLGHLEL